MARHIPQLLTLCAALLLSTAARADRYSDTLDAFRKAGDTAAFFHHCFAYAVFPTIGEGGAGIGRAFGKGRVYVHRRLVGDTTMHQMSIGLQLGGKLYSEIIFFEDQRALQEFQSGAFEFSAGASATAITASVGASAGTGGVQAGASQSLRNATTTGKYEKGMAVLTIAKGGLMYSAAIVGQKFSYTPRGGRHHGIVSNPVGERVLPDGLGSSSPSLTPRLLVHSLHLKASSPG